MVKIGLQEAGGSGAARAANWGSGSEPAYGGAGGAATSYSGGTGGGAAYNSWNTGDFVTYGGVGSSIGGAGGASAYRITGYETFIGGLSSGTGNPAGSSDYVHGLNGTGGLLMIYGNNIVNSDSGIIEANGVSSNVLAKFPGGASGGGSINIFYNDQFNDNGSITANGGEALGAIRKGGAGGNGTVTIGSIKTGIFVNNN